MLGEEDGNLELLSLHFQLSMGIYNTKSTEMGLAINTEHSSKTEYVCVCVCARARACSCMHTYHIYGNILNSSSGIGVRVCVSIMP
jgi:hypothetical protein